jgi:hypothetical protein
MSILKRTEKKITLFLRIQNCNIKFLINIKHYLIILLNPNIK